MARARKRNDIGLCSLVAPHGFVLAHTIIENPPSTSRLPCASLGSWITDL